MKVTVWFRTEPPSFFGLPENGKTVLPATEDETEAIGPTVSRHTGREVTHGSLSRYRTREDKIELTLSVGSGEVHFDDNFARVSVEADSTRQGLSQAIQLFEKLLRNVMVEYGERFDYELIQWKAGDSPPVSPEQAGLVGFEVSVTFYDLDEMEGNLQTAAMRTQLEDAQLERALRYYEHGRFVHNLRGHARSPFSPHARWLLSSSFLYLYKSITSILGDPSSDRDYQSRFRKYGLPKNYWNDAVDPLKQVRDSHDVAHYDLDPSAVEVVQEAYVKANDVCREVIRHYSDYLLSES